MDILKIAKSALNTASGDQIDVLVENEDFALTRFANSQIHQNVKKVDTTVKVRVIRDGKTGVATTNTFDEDAVKICARKACELADLSQKNPVNFDLPSPSTYKEVPSVDKATAELNPEKRADMVKEIIGIADKDNLLVAGTVGNETASFAIVNNNGVEVEQSYAKGTVSVTAMSDDSSGQASRQSPRISDINPIEVAKEACGRAVLGRNPVSIEPGEYEVVMLPYAAAEMIKWLLHMGVTASSADSGSSWIEKRMGEQVLSEKLTLIDDPFNPKLVQSKTDFEGYPKSKLPIIENGVPKNLVFNSYYSAKMGKPNTGHAVGGVYSFPLHSIVSPGDKTVEEMVANVKKGIFISRFWYTNIMDPMTVELTTMTRDGLFLIEDGELTSGLKNMRVTDKMLNVFAGIKSVGKEQILTDGILTPAFHLDSLKFSGQTKY